MSTDARMLGKMRFESAKNVGASLSQRIIGKTTVVTTAMPCIAGWNADANPAQNFKQNCTQILTCEVLSAINPLVAEMDGIRPNLT
jgi:hypothetical protein